MSIVEFDCCVRSNTCLSMWINSEQRLLLLSLAIMSVTAFAPAPRLRCPRPLLFMGKGSSARKQAELAKKMELAKKQRLQRRFRSAGRSRRGNQKATGRACRVGQALDRKGIYASTRHGGYVARETGFSAAPSKEKATQNQRCEATKKTKYRREERQKEKYVITLSKDDTWLY